MYIINNLFLELLCCNDFDTLHQIYQRLSVSVALIYMYILVLAHL